MVANRIWNLLARWSHAFDGWRIYIILEKLFGVWHRVDRSIFQRTFVEIVFSRRKENSNITSVIFDRWKYFRVSSFQGFFPSSIISSWTGNLRIQWIAFRFARNRKSSIFHGKREGRKKKMGEWWNDRSKEQRDSSGRQFKWKQSNSHVYG